MGRPCPISAATLPHARELNQRSRQAGAAMFGSLGESISQIFSITQYALAVSGDLNAGNYWRYGAVKPLPAISRIGPSAPPLAGTSSRQVPVLGYAGNDAMLA